MTPTTRAQMIDAVRVLDAIMARDAAYAAHQLRRRTVDAPPDAETRRLFAVWLDADEHALHQMTMYAARYGHTR